MAKKRRVSQKRKSGKKVTVAKGYILPHGYEVKHIVVKKKSAKRKRK